MLTVPITPNICTKLMLRASLSESLVLILMILILKRRATVYFGTQLISVGCILLKKISMWALPTVPLFAGKSRFFLREMSL